VNAREWALVAFTILGQMSVGAFLMLGVVHLLAGRTKGTGEDDGLLDRALLAVGGVLIVGMGASLLHLGSPMGAYLAVANLGSSWLSREIGFGVGYAVLGALFAMLRWRRLGSFGLRRVVAILAGMAGIGLVYSMGQVYMLPAQPSWNSVATPVGFFATSILLGCLALGSVTVINGWIEKGRDTSGAERRGEPLRAALKWVAMLSIVMLGVEFVVLPVYLASLAVGPTAAVSSVGMLTGEYGNLFWARLVLVFVGAGVFGALLYRSTSEPGRERTTAVLAVSAFALVLVSEVLGRFLFYATHVKIGL